MMDSRQESVAAGTTSRDPPRPCAGMETASCTIVFTD